MLVSIFMSICSANFSHLSFISFTHIPLSSPSICSFTPAVPFILVYHYPLPLSLLSIPILSFTCFTVIPFTKYPFVSVLSLLTLLYISIFLSFSSFHNSSTFAPPSPLHTFSQPSAPPFFFLSPLYFDSTGRLLPSALPHSPNSVSPALLQSAVHRFYSSRCCIPTEARAAFFHK